MLSVCQDSAVEENRKENRQTHRVDNYIDRLGSTNKISSSDYSLAKNQPLCKYAASKQICPYGRECRYRHPRELVKPVCQHFKQGRCRYGNRCKYVHTVAEVTHDDHNSGEVKDETSAILNIFDFPSISASKKTHQAKSQADVSKFHDSKPSEQKRVLHHHDGTQTAPVELQLEAFFKRSAKITPRPSVPRPKKKPQKDEPVTAAGKLSQIEELEMKLLREEGNDEVKERCVQVIPFQPSDPNWDFSGDKTLHLLVTFPETYPEKPPHINMIDEGFLPKSVLMVINTRLDEEVGVAHKQSVVPSGHTPILNSILKWLDSNIVSMVTAADQSTVHGAESDHTQDSSDYSDDDYTSEEEDDSEYLHPAKRGTEIRLMELSLGRNVATLRLEKLKMTVQCTRCKNKEDVMCTPEKTVVEVCDKCQSCFSVTVHCDIVHQVNPSMCFMDIIGCKPVDVVMSFCDFTITCLECQKEGKLNGLSYGEPSLTFCHSCHSRMNISIQNCKFFAHHSDNVDTDITNSAIIMKKKRKKRVKDGFIIQDGQPLPEWGTCLHYKKSHRWLRFPCCGKAYPCDVCHDSNEDHPMERANRMICGYCSKEQVYTSGKPCISCGSDLANFKFSAYWEGGKGCRNKVKMKRTDPHKYKHDHATSSKKEERVGVKGKINRYKNHPSV